MHGADTPFRHWRVLRRYVEGLFAKYNQLVAYRTCVERCVKDGDEWVVTLRKGGGKNGMDGGKDEWWQERFDAVVVASGHFNVPYVPFVEGLEEFERVNRVSVLHSKMFRGRDAFKGKVSCMLVLYQSLISPYFVRPFQLTKGAFFSASLLSAPPSPPQT